MENEMVAPLKPKFNFRYVDGIFVKSKENV